MATYKIFGTHRPNGRLTNMSDIVVAENRAEAERKFKKKYSGLKSLKIINVWKETVKGWKALKK